MGSLDQIDLVFWEKLVIPVILAVLSWFLKDYLVGIQRQRQEATRAEWKARLSEVWSPLFYWSGVIRFRDSSQSWERYGTKELGVVLSKAAHLLPLRHYHVLVRLLERATNQKTKDVSDQELANTRRYIYGQIEILNHALYGQYTWFDPANGSDVFGSARLALRVITELSIHLAIWLTIVLALLLMYVAFEHGYRWILVLPIGFIFFLMVAEVRRRVRLRRTILGRIKT